MTLNISPTLSLPPDFVTSTQAILAKKGSGKSYLASVQAEELLGAGHQVVVIDPTGAWFGLRSSADGKAPGFPIAVLGGDHGDVPLETTAGEVIADAIAADHFSAVLDLSLFRKGEALRFMAAFLETLYRRNRDALHLFIDEADVVAPQRTFGVDDARTLGATEDVVRRGRIRGLGCTLITQRPQVLNKNVLSQVDMMTALRMNHPKDIGAIKEWIAVHGDEAQAARMIASLPSLPTGTAWFWNPASDLFAKAEVRRRRTFDSGATPKSGGRVAAPKVLAPVDLARLGATIAATVERVKENDPKALKVEVARLRAELAKKPIATPSIDREAVAAAYQAGIAEGAKDTAWAAKALGDIREALTHGLADCDRTLATLSKVAELRVPPAPTTSRRAIAAATFAADGHEQVRVGKHEIRRLARATIAGDTTLAGGERKILTVLSQYPTRSKQQLAILTGYAVGGGGFGNYLGALRSKGYLEGDAAALRITDAGATAVGPVDPLPTGRALFEHWLGELGKAEREILRVLFEEWPAARPKDYVATKAGYEPKGGGFGNALGRLRTLGLIEGKAKLKAADALHEVPHG